MLWYARIFVNSNDFMGLGGERRPLTENAKSGNPIQFHTFRRAGIFARFVPVWATVISPAGNERS
jgi:hypothetical protein